MRTVFTPSTFRSLFPTLVLLAWLIGASACADHAYPKGTTVHASSAIDFDEAVIDDTTQGRVVWAGEDCDYAIIETRSWFSLVETYSGSLEVGDRVEGAVTSFGFKSCRKNGSRDLRIYVENYYTSRAQCMEWLEEKGKCD